MTLTVGVEEEYQLVDPESGALRSRADQVLGLSWTEELEGELQDTMLEVQTPPCRTMGEVLDHLRRRRLIAATAAGADDLEIVAAGVHPFSDWRAHSLAPGDRAEMLGERFGRVARDEHTFGMHVHVARPDRGNGTRLLAEVRWLTPALVALSASSPFFQDDDTGYASYRSIVHRRYPLNGPPPDLGSRSDHDAFLDTLVRAGMIPDRRTVYWTVRLSTVHPTIEFRGADACPSLQEAAALAALARAAVVHVHGGRPLRPTRAAAVDTSLLDLNEWQAARYGLDARVLHTGDASRALGMRQEVERLLELLAPTLERLGDGRAVETLERVLEDGNTADRIRRVHRRTRDMVAVVHWLRAETQAGLYRNPRGGNGDRRGASP
jgi:glutamate---cysteine ligase / carboxylate-amine ligase